MSTEEKNKNGSKKRSFEESFSESAPPNPSKKRKMENENQNPEGAIWSCRHCTFDNELTDDQCAICLNPRSDDTTNQIPDVPDVDTDSEVQQAVQQLQVAPKPVYIYVVMTAMHEIGTGSDYFMDSTLKETYDTEIIATYASKEQANKRAKREAFIYEGDPEDLVTSWTANSDPSLFFHEGDLEDGLPYRSQRVWVEEHVINYNE